MQIDPRLSEIYDCLYRVATKAIIVRGESVLLVQELPELWWGFPGGGVDYGEKIEQTLVREIEEELGIPAQEVSSDFKLVHYSVGTIVDTIPRVNLFYKVTVPEQLFTKTGEVAKWEWFTKHEFMELNLSPTYPDIAQLAAVIFSDNEQ